MGLAEKLAIAAILLALLLLFVSFSGLPTPKQAGLEALYLSEAAPDAIIYKNEACGHCSMYLGNLKQFFEEKGISYIEKSVINDETARLELLEFNTRKNISPELQGHMTIVLKDKLILQGHVPVNLVKEVIESNPKDQPPEMLFFQDLMVDETEIESYTVRNSAGDVYNCPANSTASECLKQQNNPQQENSIFQWLPVIILVSGILAGIHPCTIGVLLFFMSFLFTIHRTRLNVLKIGGAYIAGVFLAYFLIGLGLLKAVAFAEPHFAAKIAAYLVIALGMFNIARYFFPKIRGFGIPEQSKGFIAGLVEKGSMPAAVVVGLFVGVCSFGCTAGIYFSILGMLITQPTFGVLYLLLYNLMFILPLIAILFLATNDKVVEKISRLEVTKTRLITLIAGLLMVVLGIVILLFIAGGM